MSGRGSSLIPVEPLGTPGMNAGARTAAGREARLSAGSSRDARGGPFTSSSPDGGLRAQLPWVPRAFSPGGALRDSGRILAVASALLVSACHDVSSFSTASGGSYEGPISSASFVRAGLGEPRLCLTIDTTHLQDTPGTLTTTDGLFQQTALRSIPQLWQDPLSTLTFGEGRIQNVVYVAHGNPLDGGPAGDVFVVISFMNAGGIEVRLLRGAPDAPGSLFGVFALTRGSGSCPY